MERRLTLEVVPVLDSHKSKRAFQSRYLNLLPVLEGILIPWFGLFRRNNVILLVCISLFVLSSLPILSVLGSRVRLQMECRDVSEITGRTKLLFKEFFVSWWGFVAAAFLLGAARCISTAMSSFAMNIGLFVMSMTVLFGLFGTMMTGWALTNMGNFKRGQFGYTLTLIIEFALYNVMLFLNVVV